MAITSTHQYDNRLTPPTRSDYDETWWGIARIINTVPTNTRQEKLIRATLQAAWEAIEVERERHWPTKVVAA